MTDAPNTADGLESAFQLPADIARDLGLAGLYESMVERLRREARGLPMNTVQQLLIERIASFYVQIKYRERNNSWAGINQQKEFNAYWLSLTSEFNKLLAASEDTRRQAMLTEVQDVVTKSLELIKDETDRKNVRRRLAGDFAAINL